MADGTDRRFYVPRVLWGALVASTCLFLGVLLYMQQVGTIPAEPTEPFMIVVVGVVALGVAVASVIVPRQIHLTSLAHAKLEVNTEVDERGGAALFRDAAPTIRVFADGDRARRAAFVRYQTPFILGMAMSEAISLFGFSMGMVGFPLLEVLPFWLVSWALMIVRFPTPRRVFGPLEAAYDAVLP